MLAMARSMFSPRCSRPHGCPTTGTSHARRVGLKIFSSSPEGAGVVLPLPSRRARVLFLIVWFAMLGLGGRLLLQEFRGYARAALFQDAEGLEEALRFIPHAPEVHEQLGMIYLLDPAYFDPGRALRHFRRAVALSPRDARLWVNLGRAYEAEGDGERAAASYRQAIALAPHHFRPRWIYANFLLRREQTDAALEQLSALIEATPEAVENICELIWHVREGDAALLRRLVEGRPSWIALKVSDYLMAKGRFEDAIALWRALPPGDDAAREGGRRLVRGLRRAGQWTLAERIWREWLRRAYGQEPTTALWNGGFEHPPVEGGFDWQMAPSPQVDVSIDETVGYGDSRSLRVEFLAREQVRYAGVWREIVVAPATSYVLRFAYRTQEMLSPNGLYVEVVDAEDPQRLRARLAPLKASEAWTVVQLEFQTTPRTRAIRLILGREPMHPLYDYIRGRAWFDAFALERISDGPHA